MSQRHQFKRHKQRHSSKSFSFRRLSSVIAMCRLLNRVTGTNDRREERNNKKHWNIINFFFSSSFCFTLFIVTCITFYVDVGVAIACFLFSVSRTRCDAWRWVEHEFDNVCVPYFVSAMWPTFFRIFRAREKVCFAIDTSRTIFPHSYFCSPDNSLLQQAIHCQLHDKDVEWCSTRARILWMCLLRLFWLGDERAADFEWCFAMHDEHLKCFHVTTRSHCLRLVCAHVANALVLLPFRQ